MTPGKIIIQEPMSLLRLPFAVTLIWAVSTAMTPPQRPPSKEERVRTHDFDANLPPAVKILCWIIGLAEIFVVLAHAHPCGAVSHWLLSQLNHSAFLDVTPHTNPAYLLAWICTIVGALIRKRCYDVMGEMFTFELSIRRNHRLVTTGPYAFVRHPSYTAAILTTFGALGSHTLPGSYFMEEVSYIVSPWLAQAVALAFWLIGFLSAILMLSQRIPLEDTMLRREFGSQWDEWARKVPYRLIPGIY